MLFLSLKQTTTASLTLKPEASLAPISKTQHQTITHSETRCQTLHLSFGLSPHILSSFPAPRTEMKFITQTAPAFTMALGRFFFFFPFSPRPIHNNNITRIEPPFGRWNRARHRSHLSRVGERTERDSGGLETGLECRAEASISLPSQVKGRRGESRPLRRSSGTSDCPEVKQRFQWRAPGREAKGRAE